MLLVLVAVLWGICALLYVLLFYSVGCQNDRVSSTPVKVRSANRAESDD